MFVRLAVLILAPAMLYGQDVATGQSSVELSKQIAEMNAVIQKLQSRVDELEKRLTPAPPAGQTPSRESANPQVPPPPAQPQPAQVAATQEAALPPSQQTTPNKTAISNLLSGTSVNFLLDCYYGYNFNDPIGRVSRLRAYDVISNAFSLNQATVVLENAPNVAIGKRWGLRLDLQFGEATETLQGNPSNEPRPDIYRNVFQAYGTYVIPVGSGLTVDFGKFASSLGIEGNFTQDQMNYSRSYWFNFLPFYHMGVRMNYQLTKAIGVNYWLTNGTQQTEPFNNFKDQFVGLAIQPNENFSWNVNYYFGQEHPDVTFLPNSTDPSLPTAQGVPFQPISSPPGGKLHIIDSYATWRTTKKLTLALEGDYVIERLYHEFLSSAHMGCGGLCSLSGFAAPGGRGTRRIPGRSRRPI